jgi:hypothetical protein
MTKEETHDYLFLLCEQADSATGSISHKIWDKLKPCEEIAEKFELDLNGYFNVRMRDILHKRSSFIESRKANLMGTHKGSRMEKRKEKTEKGNKNTDNEKGKLKNKTPDPPLVYPFTDELFLNRWTAWREYKQEQFRFTYKPRGEQAALKLIGELSKGSVQVAVAIIEQSMANGWKGFFELNSNGKPDQKAISDGVDEILKKHGVDHGRT